MPLSRSFKAFLFLLPMMIACGSADHKATDSIADSVKVQQPAGSYTEADIAIQTITVKDSADKLKGYGYDIYVSGKRTIHQPIIPAVPGNDAFATEEQAKSVGELAKHKMIATGSFPTITIHELDSLGIKHQ